MLKSWASVEHGDSGTPIYNEDGECIGLIWGYRAWGSDLTTERSPIEAGIGAFARNEAHPLMAAVQDRPNDWDMVLLELDRSVEAYPYYAHGLWQGGLSVGVVTSAAFGHRTGKSLALAYLRDKTARSNLEVDVLGQPVPATILDCPPFDPDNQRLRFGGETHD